MHYKNIYFFIGTTAELIKMMPVMQVCWRRGIPFQLVASGQNDIRHSELLALVGKKAPDLVLFEGEIRKSAVSLLLWFFRTLLRSVGRLRRHMRQLPGSNVVVVHGDTVSTVMGALLAKVLRTDVAHVEAGLRSFNYLHPFPEEIDRVITSRLADIHFCPNDWSMRNLGRLGGRRSTRATTRCVMRWRSRSRPVAPGKIPSRGWKGRTSSSCCTGRKTCSTSAWSGALSRRPSGNHGKPPASSSCTTSPRWLWRAWGFSTG
ncbi:hypothetical protein C8245_01540 [Paracidovorax avenae]|nr:hypothetical protein C8245_01540 [Paracidovorax avenae]